MGPFSSHSMPSWRIYDFLNCFQTCSFFTCVRTLPHMWQSYQEIDAKTAFLFKCLNRHLRNCICLYMYVHILNHEAIFLYFCSIHYLPILIYFDIHYTLITLLSPSHSYLPLYKFLSYSHGFCFVLWPLSLTRSICLTMKILVIILQIQYDWTQTLKEKQEQWIWGRGEELWGGIGRRRGRRGCSSNVLYKRSIKKVS